MKKKLWIITLIGAILFISLFLLIACSSNDWHFELEDLSVKVSFNQKYQQFELSETGIFDDIELHAKYTAREINFSVDLIYDGAIAGNLQRVNIEKNGNSVEEIKEPGVYSVRVEYRLHGKTMFEDKEVSNDKIITIRFKVVIEGHDELSYLVELKSDSEIDLYIPPNGAAYAYIDVRDFGKHRFRVPEECEVSVFFATTRYPSSGLTDITALRGDLIEPQAEGDSTYWEIGQNDCYLISVIGKEESFDDRSVTLKHHYIKENMLDGAFDCIVQPKSFVDFYFFAEFGGGYKLKINGQNFNLYVTDHLSQSQFSAFSTQRNQDGVNLYGDVEYKIQLRNESDTAMLYSISIEITPDELVLGEQELEYGVYKFTPRHNGEYTILTGNVRAFFEVLDSNNHSVMQKIMDGKFQGFLKGDETYYVYVRYSSSSVDIEMQFTPPESGKNELFFNYLDQGYTISKFVPIVSGRYLFHSDHITYQIYHNQNLYSKNTFYAGEDYYFVANRVDEQLKFTSMQIQTDFQEIKHREEKNAKEERTFIFTAPATGYYFIEADAGYKVYSDNFFLVSEHNGKVNLDKDEVYFITSDQSDNLQIYFDPNTITAQDVNYSIRYENYFTLNVEETTSYQFNAMPNIGTVFIAVYDKDLNLLYMDEGEYAILQFTLQKGIYYLHIGGIDRIDTLFSIRKQSI